MGLERDMAVQLEDCKGGGRWRGSTPQGFRGFKRLKAGKRQARMPYNKTGAAKADGQRAWWQLPRGSHGK